MILPILAARTDFEARLESDVGTSVRTEEGDRKRLWAYYINEVLDLDGEKIRNPARYTSRCVALEMSLRELGVDVDALRVDIAARGIQPRPSPTVDKAITDQVRPKPTAQSAQPGREHHSDPPG